MHTSAHCLIGSLLIGGAAAAATTKAGRILVIAPLGIEYESVVTALRDPHPAPFNGRHAVEGRIGSTELVVVRSGWGKAHAAAATAEGIQRYRPALVAVVGLGGAILGTDLEPGDVVVAARVFDHDLGKAGPKGFEPWNAQSPDEEQWPAEFETQPAATLALARAAATVGMKRWTYDPGNCPIDPNEPPGDKPARAPGPIGRLSPRICLGKIATGDVFVATPDALSELSRRGADVVDMESAAVAETAKVANVPFLSLRIVSDVVGVAGSDYLYYCLKAQGAARLTAVLKAFPDLRRARIPAAAVDECGTTR